MMDKVRNGVGKHKVLVCLQGFCTTHVVIFDLNIWVRNELRSKCCIETNIFCWVVGPGEPHEVQQVQVKGLAPGLWQPSLSVQAGGWKYRAHLCWKGPDDTSGWQVKHEPAMCPHRPESQPYPGLHQKSVPCSSILHSKTSPEVLHADVESSVQKIYGPVRAHLEEGHENDPRDGTHPLRQQAERAGSVQPWEEEALVRSDSGLLVSKWGL